MGALDIVSSTGSPRAVHSGVVTGKDLIKLLDFAKKEQCVALLSPRHVGHSCGQVRDTGPLVLDSSRWLPTSDCCRPLMSPRPRPSLPPSRALGTSRDTFRGFQLTRALSEAKAPVILQLSQGGAAFFGGKGLKNDQQQASIAGAVAAAHYIRAIAPAYGMRVTRWPVCDVLIGARSPVILHSDHCAKKLLPWFDGMLEADERYYKEHKAPLFSSHMLDLSEEDKDENIATCVRYFKRMAAVDLWLEMEIGITGGEEDGVDNTDVDNAALYTQPEDIWDIYKALSAVSPMFSIAAAFGNVHGVYKPGNVRLHPELLEKHQAHVSRELGGKDPRPVFLVFHGGSGSSKAEITTAVKNGVVKMNIDTDTQWAYMLGFRDYFAAKKDYVASQVGNPDGPDKPNKKFYDPRVWVREGELTMKKRVQESCADLLNENRL